MTQTLDVPAHTVSVVIPVYQGAATLPALMDEIAPLVHRATTPEGRELRVTEVLLVIDALFLKDRSMFERVSFRKEVPGKEPPVEQKPDAPKENDSPDSSHASDA